MANQAAWLRAVATPFDVGSADEYSPGPGEVLVRNKVVAVNPVDWKMQDTGFLIQTYPRILGCDVAGEIVKVGGDVTGFKTGDRIIGHCMSLMTGEAKHSGFQLYTVLPVSRAAILPSSMSFAQGSVLPLALSTAADGLYGSRAEGFLGLELPTVDGRPESDVIVVYGGSSSVGALAIQLAAKSGARVITLASPRNADFCKDAGAAEVFDYKDPQVVDKVVEAVKRSGLRFVGVYDAIGLIDQSYKITLPILEKLGGGNVPSVLEVPDSLPSGIKSGHIMAPRADVRVWADFVPQALAKGTLKAIPAPKVIGKGLEIVQQGLEENKRGVSASKIVIEL